MTRIRIVLLSRDERAVLWQLGADGIIELAASPDDETGIPLARQDCTTALSQMDNLSGRLERLREVLTLTPASPTAEGRCLNLTQVEQSLQAMEAQLGELPAERHQLAQQVTEKQAARARAEIVPGLTLPPFAPEESSFLHFAVGSLPATGTLQLGAEGRAVVIPLAAAGDRKRMLIIVPRRDQKTLHQTLQQAGFQQDLAAGGGIATSGVDWEVLQREYEQVQARLTETTAKLHVLATKFAPIWASAACTLKTERCLLDAAAQLSRTAAATLITGWVPQASVPQLERSLRARTQGRYVITATDPEKPEEDVPVLIRHARLLRPFGALVRGFGLPHYWEVEPTPFVAISYILMFGMMFGDVGHGFLLVAGGAIARWASRQETVRDAGVLLVTGGGASMLFGALYGSYFGLEATRAWALWRDPLAGDPVRLMAVAVYTGSVMISIGLLLNIINRIRGRDIIGAWLGGCGVAGIVFYWGALALLTSYERLRAAHLLVAAIGLFLAVPVVAWLLRKPLEHRCQRRGGSLVETHSWQTELAETLVEAFEVVLSYLANTISFVRLAAYAMSHAALLLSVFLVAEMVRAWPGGAVWAILVITLGNLGVLLLEGVIAAMQALRLEYYEFFSKFYVGGGRAFTPFRLPETHLRAQRP